MYRIGRLADGREVIVNRKSRTHAEVSVDSEIFGFVTVKMQPQRDAVMTQFMNTRYGEQIARGLGFGEEEAFVARDSNNRPISVRTYNRIEQAAMVIARHAVK